MIWKRSFSSLTSFIHPHLPNTYYTPSFLFEVMQNIKISMTHPLISKSLKSGAGKENKDHTLK